MPVPVRDTPLGRELYQEGRDDGRQEGRQEGEEQTVLRLTNVMLRRRFSGDEARLSAVAARLAALPARSGWP
jgi:predicted transposase YdaD